MKGRELSSKWHSAAFKLSRSYQTIDATLDDGALGSSWGAAIAAKLSAGSYLVQKRARHEQALHISMYYSTQYLSFEHVFCTDLISL